MITLIATEIHQEPIQSGEPLVEHERDLCSSVVQFGSCLLAKGFAYDRIRRVSFDWNNEESMGSKNLLSHVLHECVYDIIITCTLYRTGVERYNIAYFTFSLKLERNSFISLKPRKNY